MNTIAPTTHRNGTGKTALLQQIRDANRSLTAAIDAMTATAPNERDYYTERAFPENYHAARAAHKARILDLHRIQAEIMDIGEKIADQTE